MQFGRHRPAGTCAVAGRHPAADRGDLLAHGLGAALGEQDGAERTRESVAVLERADRVTIVHRSDRFRAHGATVAQYQSALAQAEARDDLTAIGNLSFNLVVAQLRANQAAAALATARRQAKSMRP